MFAVVEVILLIWRVSDSTHGQQVNTVIKESPTTDAINAGTTVFENVSPTPILKFMKNGAPSDETPTIEVKKDALISNPEDLSAEDHVLLPLEDSSARNHVSSPLKDSFAEDILPNPPEDSSAEDSIIKPKNALHKRKLHSNWESFMKNKLKCEDDDPDECPNKKDLCKDSFLVQLNCKKTCGICVVDCQDRIPDCHMKKENFSCHDSTLMQMACKKTCGLCFEDDLTDDVSNQTDSSKEKACLESLQPYGFWVLKNEEHGCEYGAQKLTDIGETDTHLCCQYLFDPLVSWNDTRHKTNEEKSAYSFIKKIDAVSSKLCYSTKNAKWEFYTDITRKNRNKYEAVQLKVNKWMEKYFIIYKTEGWDWQNFDDKDLRRQFQLRSILGSHGLSSDSKAVLANARLEVVEDRIYINLCEYKPTPQGNKTSTIKKKCDLKLPVVKKYMANSDSYKELVYYWTSYRDKITKLHTNVKYNKLIHLFNEAAKLNDYSNAVDMWQALDYGQKDWFYDMGMLWKGVLPLYKEIHAYVRSKLRIKHGKSKIGYRSPIPAHLLGDMWAKRWDKKFILFAPFPDKLPLPTDVTIKGYNGKDLAKIANDFFMSLNFSRMPEEFWTKSIFEKSPNRHIKCSEMTWDFCNHKDYRMVVCPPFNAKQLLRVHSAMARLQYYMQYHQQPKIYRQGANQAFEMGVGSAILLSIDNPNHFHKIGLIKNMDDDYKVGINILMKRALETVVYLPYALTLNNWRSDVFVNQTKFENWNCFWWRLRLNNQGIKPPILRSDKDFDPGTISDIVEPKSIIKRFIGIILQFQFHRALCIKAKKYNPKDEKTLPLHMCDISDSKEAGEALKKMMSFGRSQVWRMTLKNLTGSNVLDPTALREYFKPLEDWLRNENLKNDEYIGWEIHETFCKKHKEEIILEQDHKHVHLHLYSDTCDEFKSLDNISKSTEQEINQLLEKLLKWKN